MQVVSVARVGGLSNSESSEEEDAQVIYLLPISAETGNMGLREGNGGAAEPEPNANTNPNANIHQRPEPNPNPDPNPAHMQQIPTAAPATGIQDTPAPQGGAPPSAGAGHLQQASTGGQDGAAGGAITPCKHAGGIANAKANVPPL
ncbi:circumsporozoite protein-like [Trichomycterus rosablanca]|uniref:circumsporozoite protein-like n=1 Tax=Trichomycterus rosablanca TaxID=2290929 RepID=UPI002F35FFFB